MRSTYFIQMSNITANISKLYLWHQHRSFNQNISCMLAPANIALKSVQAAKETPVNMKFGNTFKDITKIPGPKILPIIGSSLSVVTHPGKTLLVKTYGISLL